MIKDMVENHVDVENRTCFSIQHLCKRSKDILEGFQCIQMLYLYKYIVIYKKKKLEQKCN